MDVSKSILANIKKSLIEKALRYDGKPVIVLFKRALKIIDNFDKKAFDDDEKLSLLKNCLKLLRIQGIDVSRESFVIENLRQWARTASWVDVDDVSPYDLKYGMRQEDGIYFDDLYDNSSFKAYRTMGGKVQERIASKEIAYVGILLKEGELADKHVTLEFFDNKPEEYKRSVLKELPLGKEVTITTNKLGTYSVPGYGCQNVGYQVELPNELKKFFKGKIPHVTTEVMNGGKAANTWKAFTEEGEAQDIEPKSFRGVVATFYHGNESTTSIEDEEKGTNDLQKIASNLFAISDAFESKGFKRIAKFIEQAGDVIMEEA